MHTIDPQVFVEFKTWMSQRPDREPIKRRRDALQAQVVTQMLDNGLLPRRGPALSPAQP